MQYAIQNQRVLLGDPVKPRVGKRIINKGNKMKQLFIFPQNIESGQTLPQNYDSLNELSTNECDTLEKPASKQIKEVRFVSEE